MSKQRRLAHLFGSSRAPASRGSAAEETENEEDEAEEGQEEETEEGQEEETEAEEQDPETEEDAAEGEGEGEEEEDDGGDDGASAAGLAALNVMTCPEAKGREALAKSLARDVATGKMSERRAVSLLKAAPRTGGLAKAMKGRDRNPGTEPAATGRSGGGKLAAHEEALVAAAEARAKRRAERRR